MCEKSEDFVNHFWNIYKACIKRDKDIVEILLENKANINANDNFGKTALIEGLKNILKNSIKVNFIFQL